MLLRSFVEAAMLSMVLILAGIAFGANDMVFSPMGFGAILVTFFLEIFGNRW
ncbi:MAG: hypothetical protein HY544_04855 [Candidatus Diapherotrites archaeon]|uniref:Uncharacterized protein n=1 Tax=Candidatus Iainarchaeum sp. TaxID=3101447 RepID=A0A8T3YP74_9ARCH|nr:hypothetical protein [Candidatus Diapherotrites archaeon]